MFRFLRAPGHRAAPRADRWHHEVGRSWQVSSVLDSLLRSFDDEETQCRRRGSQLTRPISECCQRGEIVAGERRMIDPEAPTYGLPRCLLIPISAVIVDEIRLYVSEVLLSRTGRNGRVNAVCVLPQDYPVLKDPRVRLWKQPDAGQYEERLHPKR